MVIKKDDCCGCTACENVCPHNAITMQADDEGFLHPVINKEICTECDMCKNVCAFVRDMHLSNENIENMHAYAAKHRNDSIFKESTSGGAFTAFSDYILENNGYIVGCTFNNDFSKVIYTVTNDSKIRDSMRGSKYIQAELGSTFKRVKNLLKEKQNVFFIGTPCHVAGLKGYLKNVDTTTLTTCDIICHGAPSPLIWKDYITNQQEIYADKLSYVRFRDKSAEYRHRGICDNGSEINLAPYMDLYNSCYIIRPSCHRCPYTKLQRDADITIGDFWGVEQIFSTYNAKEGTSLIITRTTKGQRLMESVKENLVISECEIMKCLQPNLQYPTAASKKRDEFWKNYYKRGINYVAHKYTSLSFYIRFKRFLRQFINGEVNYDRHKGQK